VELRILCSLARRQPARLARLRREFPGRGIECTYTIQTTRAVRRRQALKVRRGTGNEAWLWIESRQNTGLYSSRLSSSLFTGALIRYQDSTTATKATCSTSRPDQYVCRLALPSGQTWTDPYSNVSVTVNSVAAGR